MDSLTSSAIRCVCEAGNILGEAPIWCEETGRLWWTDVHAATLHSLDPSTGEHAAYPLQGKHLGSFCKAPGGTFLIALDNGLCEFHPATGRVIPRIEVEPESLGTRLNDAKCDRKGRFWIGSMDLEIKEPLGAFYRVDPDMSVHRIFDDVLTPNSIAFSPEDDRLYFSDTRRHKIWTFDLDAESGEIFNRRIFADLSGYGGRPDGSTVDCEGFLWNAEFAFGRIVRYAPDGRRDRIIELPVTEPTSITFGGPDHRTLYITTARLFLSEDELAGQPLAGHLLAMEVGVAGLPEPVFGRPG